MPNTTFNTIDNKRIELGLTKRQMSKYLGVSEFVYAHWRKGVTPVPSEMLKKAVNCKKELVKCPCCGNITV